MIKQTKTTFGKRILLLALTLILILPAIALNPAPLTAEATGLTLPANGFIAPIESPVVGSIAISNRADLENIGKDSNYPLKGKYHLTADINLAGKEWIPINGFMGTFDGQGHIISNLKITGDIQQAGLFSNISDAIIKNVGLKDTDINISSSTFSTYAGGICGKGASLTISNCYNIGKVSASSAASSYAGGIYGEGMGPNISNCYNMSEVKASSTSSSYAGGIYGKNSSRIGNISDCYNKGKVSSSSISNTSASGGIFCSQDMIISNCYNEGEVSALSSSASFCSYAGGISSGSVRDIQNCFNTGKVSASSYYLSYAGGICGANGGGGITFSDCYNRGYVSASSSASYSRAGGICGNISGSVTLKNAYNIGGVSASSPSPSSSYAGGICGSSDNVTICNTYWNIESEQKVNNTILINANKKGIGTNTYHTTSLTTAQMKQQASFTGFDFTTVWSFRADVNDDYPILPVTKIEYAPDPYEPNDTRATAFVYNSVTQLNINELYNQGYKAASLHSGDDIDYFYMNITDTSPTYFVNLRNLYASRDWNIKIERENTNGTITTWELTNAQATAQRGTHERYFYFKPDMPGKYYVVVSGDGVSERSYYYMYVGPVVRTLSMTKQMQIALNINKTYLTTPINFDATNQIFPKYAKINTMSLSNDFLPNSGVCTTINKQVTSSKTGTVYNNTISGVAINSVSGADAAQIWKINGRCGCSLTHTANPVISWRPSMTLNYTYNIGPWPDCSVQSIPTILNPSKIY